MTCTAARRINTLRQAADAFLSHLKRQPLDLFHLTLIMLIRTPNGLRRGLMIVCSPNSSFWWFVPLETSRQ